MSIQQIQNEIIRKFSSFEDWLQRYDYLIELGKSLPLIDEAHKTDNFIIKGCQSKVWLYADFQDNKVVFTADSDAIITKGIIALLIEVFSHQPPDAILKADLSFIDEIGLREHLSPTRANGLVSMIDQMKRYALVYQLKSM